MFPLRLAQVCVIVTLAVRSPAPASTFRGLGGDFADDGSTVVWQS